MKPLMYFCLHGIVNWFCCNGMWSCWPEITVCVLWAPRKQLGHLRICMYRANNYCHSSCTSSGVLKNCRAWTLSRLLNRAHRGKMVKRSVAKGNAFLKEYRDVGQSRTDIWLLKIIFWCWLVSFFWLCPDQEEYRLYNRCLLANAWCRMRMSWAASCAACWVKLMANFSYITRSNCVNCCCGNHAIGIRPQILV